jgi:PAS domain S-box-containing protein
MHLDAQFPPDVMARSDRASKEVAESERLFRNTFDNAAVGMAHKALDGRWIRVNDRFCEIIGHSREELLRSTFQELTHPDDLPGELANFAALLEGRTETYRMEKRYLRSDGSVAWTHLTASLSRKPSGEPEYFIAVIEDVSARQRAEKELRESETRFKDVLLNSPLPLLVYDDRGGVLALSRAWSEIAGRCPDAGTIQAWATGTFDQQAADAVLSYLQSQWSEHESGRQVEVDLVTPDGEPRTLLLAGSSLSPAGDGRRLRLCAATDITQRKAAERSLLEASRQKDEFLAMLSHELRNPLAAVRSAAELLRLHPAGDQILVRTQSILERQTGHMAKLLDGLLDVSRIIRGKIALDPRVVDLAEACRSVLSDLEPIIEQSGLTLRRVLPDTPVWVSADDVRLTQIIDNLLSNAVRYTDRGGTITVTLTSGHGLGVLAVQDTGVGIEPDLLPHIFDVFRQSRQNLDRSVGGLGLGLALVRSLVELHGGSLTGASEGAGRGSEFIVRLPLVATPPVVPPAVQTAPEPARILLIEDNDDAAEMLAAALEIRGHHVVRLSGGQDALLTARRVHPDIVLCDLGLPGGVTGYDVARELRMHEDLDDVALIALTGYGRPEDKRDARTAGFDTHLTKPVDLDALERTMTTCRHDRRMQR